MPDNAQTLAFIRSAFRSVWALELMCVLRSSPDQVFGPAELVERLRASDLVVRQGLQGLEAAGLVVAEPAGARYAPATAALDGLAAAAVTLYERKPDMVRRTIVMAGTDPLSAFSDAFRFRRD